MKPKSKPMANYDKIMKLQPKKKQKKFDHAEHMVWICAVRGYYLNTMGKKGKNDRGIYDDAIFVVSPNHFSSYNGNTDPSRQYKKRLAQLEPGVWLYKKGKHGYNRKTPPYPALRQAANVTVKRDGVGLDTGIFHINIHRGGWKTTSSAGCQTIHPTQWKSFIDTVYNQMTLWGQKTIPYVLVENDGKF